MAQTTIGSILIDVEVDTQKLIAGFDKAEKTVNKSTINMKKAMASINAQKLALDGVVAFTSAIKGSIDAAEGLSKISKNLSMNVQDLSRLEYASNVAGVSMQSLETAISAMNKSTSDFKEGGTGAASKAMDELGISVEFARKNFTDTNTTFSFLLEKLGNVESATLRSKLAQDLFSQSGTDMVRLASMGATELQRLGDEGERVGTVISDSMAKNASEFNNNIEKLSQNVTGITNDFTNEMLPTLNEMSGYIVEHILSHKEDILEFGYDVGRTVQLIVNGYETLFLGFKTGQLEAVITFKSTIEDAINYVMKTITETNNYWANTWIGEKLNLSKMEFTEIVIDEGALQKELEETKKGLVMLGVENQKLTEDILNNTLAQQTFTKEVENSTQKQKEQLAQIKKEAQIEPSSNLSKKVATGGGTSFSKEELDAEQSLYDEMLKEIESEEAKRIEKEQALSNAKIALADQEGQQLADIYLKHMSPMEKFSIEFEYEENLLLKYFEEGSEVMKRFYAESEKRASELRNTTAKSYEGISGSDWMPNLDGKSKAIVDVAKAMGKVQEENAAWNKFKAENNEASEDEEKHNQNLVSLYGDLSGAMAASFEEGSAAAIAFGTVQKSMALIDGVGAVIKAWNSAAFPYNMVSVIPTVVGVASLLSEIGVAFNGGAGGGGGGISQTEKNQNTIDATYNPVTDRLDAQIKLLESIDNKSGTASQASMNKAKVEYDKSLASYANEKAYEMHGSIKQGWGAEGLRGETFDALTEQLGFSLGTLGKGYDTSTNSMVDTDALEVDRQAISDPDNFIALLEAFNSGYIDSLTSDWYVLFDKGWKDTNMNASEFAKSQLEAMTAEYQGFVSDFAKAIFDSRGELMDAKETLENLHDAISGTDDYEKARLKKAQDIVDGLKGKKSFSEYLSDEAQNISNLDGILSKVTEDGTTYEDILVSQDPAKLKLQNEILSEIQDTTNQVFDEGGKSVLNYIESIELVGEAEKAIVEERKSLEDEYFNLTATTQEIRAKELEALDDSNKALQERIWLYEDEQEILNEKKNLQQQVFDLIATEDEQRTATLMGLNEANRIYQEFIWAVEDAQEAKEKALNEEKEIIDQELKDIAENISTLEGAFGNIEQTIEKFKGTLTDSKASLSDYYLFIGEALTLSATDNYEAYSESLSKAIEASDALYNEENFASENDMRFAQMVALNQFESLEDTTMTQIDVLKEIEKNTSDTAQRIELALKSMGVSITSAVNAAIAKNPEYTDIPNSAKEEAMNYSSSNFKDRVYAAYRAILGREPDDNGMDWWLTTGVSKGLINEEMSQIDLYSTMAKGANNKKDVYSAVDWLATNIPQQGQGQALAAKAQANGIIGRDELLDMLYKYGVGHGAGSNTYWYTGEGSVYEGTELVNSFIRGAAAAGDTYRPFATGGYTGDGNPLEYAGWVHKQEYVLNAKTTSDLGLNHGGLGVFAKMQETTQKLYKKIEELTDITEMQAEMIRNINKRDERIYREGA